MWIDFFKKELQQLELWNSPSNRSEPYFPGCVVQHERLPGLSQDSPPQGTPRGSFLSEKKDPLTEPILELTNGAFHGSCSKLSAAIDQPSVVKNTANYTCLIRSSITGHFHALLAVLTAGQPSRQGEQNSKCYCLPLSVYNVQHTHTHTRSIHIYPHMYAYIIYTICACTQ